MASGLPVIATATGGNRELIVPGVTGALVPAARPEALADALVTYAVSADTRATQGHAARIRAVHEYSLSRMLAEYRELYRATCVGTGVAN